MHWIDPQSLPATRGTVSQFVMNRDGELDGLLLSIASGPITLVHFPPHMGSDVENAIKPGDAITVHGVKPRGADVVAAVSLIASAGSEIIDQGHDATCAESKSADDEAVHSDAEVSGVVRVTLFGPRGELRGAVLEDGTAIRIGKKEAHAFADLLKPGVVLAARGTAIVCRHGTVLDAGALGADLRRLQPVKEKKEDKPKKPKKHAEDDVQADA